MSPSKYKAEHLLLCEKGPSACLRTWSWVANPEFKCMEWRWRQFAPDCIKEWAAAESKLTNDANKKEELEVIHQMAKAYWYMRGGKELPDYVDEQKDCELSIVITASNNKHKAVTLLKHIVGALAIKALQVNVEVILVDDASTDGLYEATAKFRKYNNFYYFARKKAGGRGRSVAAPLFVCAITCDS